MKPAGHLADWEAVTIEGKHYARGTCLGELMHVRCKSRNAAEAAATRSNTLAKEEADESAALLRYRQERVAAYLASRKARPVLQGRLF